MTTLEQALSASKARQIETQKQLEQLTNGFQQLQQLLLQQQLPLCCRSPITLLLPLFLQNWSLDPFAQPYQMNLTETILKG
jgi:hypothetical protein